MHFHFQYEFLIRFVIVGFLLIFVNLCKFQFQNKRGGKIVLKPIAAPDSHEWGNALNGLEAALALEKEVNQV